jgi:hypothetical protein
MGNIACFDKVQAGLSAVAAIQCRRCLTISGPASMWRSNPQRCSTHCRVQPITWRNRISKEILQLAMSMANTWRTTNTVSRRATLSAETRVYQSLSVLYCIRPDCRHKGYSVVTPPLYLPCDKLITSHVLLKQTPRDVDQPDWRCWSSVLCELVGRYLVSEEHSVSILSPEDGGNMFHRNVGICLQIHTASQPRRPTSTALPL